MTDDVMLEFGGQGLDDLTRDLKEASYTVRAEIDKTVAVIAEEIRAEAILLVSKHSKTIPPTIKVEMVPGAAVIKAGNETTPLAVLYELGNKGKGGRAKSTFRHPLFGDRDKWFDQPRHPFLTVALAANRRQITKRMESAWEKALEPHRLRPE